METYNFLQNTFEIFTLIDDGTTVQDILNAQEKIAEITNEAKNQKLYDSTESLRNTLLKEFSKNITKPEDRVIASWYHFLMKSNSVNTIHNIFVKKEMYITIIICTIPIVHHFIIEYNEYVKNIEKNN